MIWIKDSQAHTMKKSKAFPLPVWELIPWLCEGRETKMLVGSEKGTPPPEATLLGAVEPQ